MGSTRKTYSQHKEDIYIVEILNSLSISSGNYIDIGANHPSTISNTYLLYRKGFSGIIIEPNQELLGLYKWFRKRDIRIGIGCGNESQILPFQISNTPVLSTFTNVNNVKQDNYLPIMKVDDVLKKMPFKKFAFMNIDVEGMNLEVLEGAKETLKKCKVLCIEFDSDAEKETIINRLKGEFVLEKAISCNLIFVKEK